MLRKEIYEIIITNMRLVVIVFKNNLLWRAGQRWATICHPLPTYFFSGSGKIENTIAIYCYLYLHIFIILDF
jgi:hypothetical protein